MTPITNAVDHGLLEASMFTVFGLTAAFFVLLYFTYAGIAFWLTRTALPRLGIGSPIDPRPARPGQISREIRRSLVSITVFGLLTVAQVSALRAGWIQLDWKAAPLAIAIQIVVLFLWNELHFYLCHSLLHTRWLFKHVHLVHHESIVPTPFSTYSFHWLEAAMLGSVLFLATLVYDFHPVALGSLPMLSLFFNTVGHWNYDVFRGRARSASVEHSQHHRMVQGNYGFYLPFLDRWFSTKLKRRQ